MKWYSLACAALLIVAGCAAPIPSPSTTLTNSPSPIASLTPTVLPDLAQSQPAPSGALLTSLHGTGAHEIPLSVFATGSHHVALRFACAGGTTGARLTDLSGGLVMGIQGGPCDAHAIYGADFTSSSKDRAIRIGVEPDVAWEISIYWTL
jgi:hypothetical protein